MNLRNNIYLESLCFLMLLFCAACTGRKEEKSGFRAENIADSLQVGAGKIYPEYAEGFSLKYPQDGLVLVDIRDPERKESAVFRFALVGKGEKDIEIPDGYTKVEVPVSRAICMTSLQLSNFAKLGELDRIAGITSTRHLFNPEMKERLENGKTRRIGIEGNFDNEVILAVDPDLILISPFKRGGYDALRNVDVPLMPHLGYKELTPLGQAEWIKLTGLLTGNPEKAVEIFSGIEERYNTLKSKTDSVSVCPKVVSGQMQGGHWYAVGGKSFLAQLFNDAGGDYFLKDNNESGGVTLDYEKVYHDAADSDYWRIVNSFDGNYSYEALAAEDKRYVDFKAWKDKGVIYCNMKDVPFYETMPVEPEVVLADLIAIFHPDILPQHTPRYYQLMK